MGCATIDIMMLRATVTDTDPREPARVWVTIPQKYGNKPVRVFTRVQVSKGDHVYVTNTSVTRVPQWVVFDQQTEVGAWGNPYPHTHPIGQVDGLVDWVKEYEAWAKDHAARLDAADKRIAEGKVEVDAARKDLTQAQTDIAEAVRKATLERARLDQAEANLDQMGRNLTAAGGRISANETALAESQKRLQAAETTVQKTAKDLTAVDTRLTTTAGELSGLQTRVGDVASVADAATRAATDAAAAASAADRKALDAAGLAGSKGRVIYQATAPTGTNADAKNLWIRTTDNVPHTWNGSAWMARTDRTATDAASAASVAQSAASAAQGTANQAKTKVDAVTTTDAGITVIDGGKILTGSVKAKSVDAQSVAGAVGQFVKVQAVNVEVTGELAARVVNSMDTNTRNLVVTESAILQHTTLLGTTVADQLNVRGLLRGRDAILSGTVDVGQLNVTGEMSAKIISTATLQARQGFFTDGLTAQDATLLGTTVAEKLVVTDAFSARVVNAMTAQTKNLVVTEDAILNRATVVQSLVTPELITQKANVGALAANMISTGALVAQDSTGSVQINSGGITAQDATPSGTFTRQVKLTPAGLTGGTRTTQTVRIDGVNNYMVGEFSTAPNKQRVRIRSTSSVAAVDLFASNSTQDHVGIWYDSPDSNVLNAVGRVIAMTDVQHTDDSPGMLMWPMRGTFGFQGRWQQDSVATKFLVLTNFAGLGPGAYNQITIPYQSPFRTNNSLRCPFVSVESATGADVMATIIEQTASNIKVNIINQSGGKASGTIVLRVVTFNINA